MADCFCGCDRSVKSLGHVARANKVGRKITEAAPIAVAIVERYPEFADDEMKKLAADGPMRIAQVRSYVHGEVSREQLDNDGINHWFEAFRHRYANVMKEATEGWSGINPMKLTQLLVMGERAQATVVSVRDTGMTINEDPRVEITLQFVPAGGTAPVQRKTKMIVSRVAVPQRGQKVDIAYDPKDPERLSFRHATLDPTAELPVDVAGGAGAPDLAKAGADEPTDPVERLEKLAALHAAGALSAEEFADAKRQVLRG